MSCMDLATCIRTIAQIGQEKAAEVERKRERGERETDADLQLLFECAIWTAGLGAMR